MKDKKGGRMSIYLFDLDGTLTPPRLPMEKKFASFLSDWIKDKRCFIVTGSDFQKVLSQVSVDVLSLFEGVYCSMGNVLWKEGQIVYKKDFDEDPNLISVLEEIRKNTKYPHELFSNYIEKRDGMINFSVIGRNCPYPEREKYFAYDKKAHERESIRLKLMELFPQYDISIGGMISLDITQKGCGKEQVAHLIRQDNSDEKIIFFGDRTLMGGNDYLLAQELIKLGNAQVVQVSGPEAVKEFLKHE